MCDSGNWIGHQYAGFDREFALRLSLQDLLNFIPELVLSHKNFVTFMKLPRRHLSVGGEDDVVLSNHELAVSLYFELQKPLRRAVVEPVHDPARFDATSLGIVREHVDRHSLVHDLADLLGSPICQHNASAVIE